MVAALTWLIPVGGCGVAQGADANAVTVDVNTVTVDPNVGDAAVSKWRPVVWPMSGDQVWEVRLGVEMDIVEAYVAPRYDETLDSKGDVISDLRVYGIYNAVTAAMVANLLGTESAPVGGDLYAGLFAGWEIAAGQMEAGWLTGVKASLADDDHITLTTEYQYSWQSFDGDGDEHEVMIGPRFVW